MTWFKIDDAFHCHSKVVEVGNEAIGLHVRCGSWCAQQLTDGWVPGRIAVLYGATDVDASTGCLQSVSVDAGPVRKLVDAGVWLPGDGGFWLHDYLRYNRSRQQVLDEREGKTARQRRWRNNKTGQYVDASTGRLEGVSRDGVESSAPTRPVTNETLPNGSVSMGTPSVDASTQPSSQARPASTKRGTRLPHDWQVTPDLVAWARENTPDVDGKRETERFRDYWHSKAGQAARKVDWAKTWKNWMRTAQDRVRANGHAPTTPTAKANGWLDLARTDNNDHRAIGGSS